MGEMGELSEIFQWKGEVDVGCPKFTEKEREHLGEELSDVLIYLIRLSDRCGIDLPTAVLQKFEKNAKKYPAEKCFGKSDKYTAYQEMKANSELAKKEESDSSSPSSSASSH